MSKLDEYFQEDAIRTARGTGGQQLSGSLSLETLRQPVIPTGVSEHERSGVMSSYLPIPWVSTKIRVFGPPHCIKWLLKRFARSPGRHKQIHQRARGLHP